MADRTDPIVHMGVVTGAQARAIYAANPVILLPMGSHEDQGPHAGMGDYLLAEKIAELAAIRASKAGTRTLVAPVLPFGGDDFFGTMIGGISLTQSTLTQVIGDMVGSLYRNGLTRVIVINGHGGNVGPISEVAREVWQAERRLLPSLYLWRIAYGMMPKLFGAEHAAKAAGHGADPLTSIGLHLFPETFRRDAIPKAFGLKRDPVLDLPFTGFGTASFEGAEIAMPNPYEEVSHEAVAQGDPNLSNAANGATLTEALVDMTARFCAHFAKRVE